MTGISYLIYIHHANRFKGLMLPLILTVSCPVPHFDNVVLQSTFYHIEAKTKWPPLCRRHFLGFCWGGGVFFGVFFVFCLFAFVLFFASFMKMYEFRLRFHRSLFLGVQLTIPQHLFRYGLAPTRRQAIIRTNDSSFNDAHMRCSDSMS